MVKFWRESISGQENVGATWQLQASCVRVEQELRIGFVLQVDDSVGSSGQQLFWRQVEGIRQVGWLARVWILL